MRNSVPTGTLAIILVSLFAVSIPPAAQAVDIPPPRVYYTIVAHDDATQTVFLPATDGGPPVIVVPRVPVILNLTLINDGTMFHTWSVGLAADPRTQYLIDIDLPPSPTRDTTRFVEFLIAEPNRIEFGDRNETVEVVGQRIRFVCRPHFGAGMEGFIAIGSAQAETEPAEKGVFLRAYWIGLLGFAATMLLVAISYFVIKGSSPHFRDHHEHIRRGGP